ncbi:hypothetical protein GCM10011610_65870 [Nocardia rhizosphaerihabitans]|uniref:Regulatory protein n=1 Tax=Nocardia rhizosphaerihabitans TaxID=1691570 RepID=A0ABQ2L0Q1_9NOCA|nr:hypothetical protein GCM10011610_65870 [Nocardia rhizosphaerihabitans]
MFGVLKPCAHGAAKYGIDPGQWQAHMCGLCLGLRDGHGQLARAATNTDAIVLSVLTEAQTGDSGARTTAGPCPLRGMRRASVVAANAPGVQLAATASLLLGAAKIRDHIDDGDAAALARGPMRRVSSTWAARAQEQGAQIGLDVQPMLAAIATQSALEDKAASDADSLGTLDELTGPTQLCAATLFGHTATLAGRPENVVALQEIGRHVGRIAHLADAIEDLERDRARGRFNPLDATGTDMPRAYQLVRESETAIRHAAAEAELDQLPTVRWALLDPLSALLRRLGQGLGLAVGHVCRTSPVAQQHSPYQFPSPPGRRPNRPGPLKAGGLILGVYCTGVACCADHTSPCTGEEKEAWAKRCGCDGCGDCGECCGNCCSCGGEDGCCGDCGCDCSC